MNINNGRENKTSSAMTHCCLLFTITAVRCSTNLKWKEEKKKSSQFVSVGIEKRFIRPIQNESQNHANKSQKMSALFHFYLLYIPTKKKKKKPKNFIVYSSQSPYLIISIVWSRSTQIENYDLVKCRTNRTTKKPDDSLNTGAKTKARLL